MLKERKPQKSMWPSERKTLGLVRAGTSYLQMAALPMSADVYIKVKAFVLDPIPVDRESSSPLDTVVSFQISTLAFDCRRTEVGWTAQRWGRFSFLEPAGEKVICPELLAFIWKPLLISSSTEKFLKDREFSSLK